MYLSLCQTCFRTPKLISFGKSLKELNKNYIFKMDFYKRIFFVVVVGMPYNWSFYFP